jgi:hypothetical protein
MRILAACQTLKPELTNVLTPDAPTTGPGVNRSQLRILH